MSQNKEAKNCHKYEAIVVLGGGINEAGILTGRSVMRADKAAQLFNSGLSKRVIVTGGKPLNLSSSLTTEARAMKEYLIKQGVPADLIFMEEASSDTISNAYCTKVTLLEPNNWRKLLLISSRSHLPRARKVFKHILGKDYEVIDYAVPEKITLGRIFYELVVTLTISRILNRTRPGDDHKILHLISDPEYSEKFKWHPIKSPVALLKVFS